MNTKEMTSAAQLVLYVLGGTLLSIVISDVVMSAMGRTFPQKLEDLCSVIVAGLLGMLAKTQVDRQVADVQSVTTTVSKTPADSAAGVHVAGL